MRLKLTKWLAEKKDTCIVVSENPIWGAGPDRYGYFGGDKREMGKIPGHQNLHSNPTPQALS